MSLEEHGIRCWQWVEAWHVMVIGKMNLENAQVYISAKMFINVKK